MSGRPFDLVVAADADGGIGRGGALPWHLPGDLAHFKRVTTETRAPERQNAVIMGRKTWDSVPPRYRPLPRRLNLVLSRQAEVALPEGVLLEGSLDAALARLASPPLAERVERVFVVGGGQIYAQAIDDARCELIYLTRIEARFDCDTFFPAFEHAFELDRRMSEAEEGGVRYRIEVWRRR